MRDLTPLLEVEDAHRRIKFYAKTLGFSVVREFESAGQVVWARLLRGSISIMVNASQERAERGCRSSPR